MTTQTPTTTNGHEPDDTSRSRNPSRSPRIPDDPRSRTASRWAASRRSTVDKGDTRPVPSARDTRRDPRARLRPQAGHGARPAGVVQVQGHDRGRLRDRARGHGDADRRASRCEPGERRALIAHGLVVRSDLPIPEWLFGWAAAMVLVVSFVAPGGALARTEAPGGGLAAAARRLRRCPAWPRRDRLRGVRGLPPRASRSTAGLHGSQSRRPTSRRPSST